MCMSASASSGHECELVMPGHKHLMPKLFPSLSTVEYNKFK